MAQAYFVRDDDRVTLKVTILHGVTGVTSVHLGTEELGPNDDDFDLFLGTGGQLQGRMLTLTTKVVDAPDVQGGSNLTGVKYEISRNGQTPDYVNEQTETVIIDKNTASFTQTLFFTRHSGG